MRRYIRHPSDIPITYNLGEKVEHTTEQLMNICEGGLCFRSRSFIAPGTAIRLKIPVRRPAFEANGIVVRCNGTEGHYDVGVAFCDVETEFGIRMVEQICHIEHYRAEVRQREGRTITGQQAATEWIEKHASNFPH